MITTHQDGPVLIVTINRPAQRNALNAEVAAGIVSALDTAEADPTVRAVVLTGQGDKAFCAGGDLKPASDGTPFTITAHDPRHYVAALLKRMEACRLPLIAKVNGHALAGGFGLVCACDLAVVRNDALLGVSEVKVGLFPMMILPLLMRVLPQRVMAELCLTGEPITGAEALDHGIVNRAVAAADLDAATDALLSRLVDKSPTGIRLGKQALTKIREMTFDAAMEYAPLMLANMARTDDAREGFAAFGEKRSPKWTGK